MTEHQTCWETTLWNVSRQFDQCACLIVDKERRILTNWFNSPSDAGAWCLTDLCQVMEHVDGFLRQRQVGPALSLVLTQISKPSLLLLLGEQNLDDLVKSGQWQGSWLVRLCMFGQIRLDQWYEKAPNHELFCSSVVRGMSMLNIHFPYLCCL